MEMTSFITAVSVVFQVPSIPVQLDPSAIVVSISVQLVSTGRYSHLV